MAALTGTWQAAAWWLERRHPDLYGSERRRIRELERLLSVLIRKGGGPNPPVVIEIERSEA